VLDDTPVIDSDRHVVEPDDLWLTYMPEAMRDRAPRVPTPRSIFVDFNGMEGPIRRHYRDGGRTKGILPPYADERYATAAAAEFDAGSQLADMDVEGIDLAVMFPTRGLVVFGLDGVAPDLFGAAATAYNSWLADHCAAGAGRLHGVGAISLYDAEAARREVRRCVDELGFVGIFVRPNPVLGRPLHHRDYEPIWREIADAGVPLCIHEGASVSLPQVAVDRFREHAFWHACTHPMEQQMAMASMVLGGVLERNPALRVGFLECGAGWLPYWMWRLDEAAELDADQLGKLSLKPSEYVTRQCFVSADSDEDTAPGAADVLKGRHVVWGSDYPHPDAKFPGALAALAGLPWSDRDHLRRIVWDNPLEFFGESLRAAARRIVPAATQS
jgi:predicted TIM-barrel fold metal-dependent hydrolase